MRKRYFDIPASNYPFPRIPVVIVLPRSRRTVITSHIGRN